MELANKNPYSFESISKSKEWNLCLNLLLDDSISEIESNGPGLFFYKKSGKRLHLDMIDDPSPERYMQGVKEGLVPFVHSPWPFQENSYLFEGPLRYEAGGKYIRGRCHIVLPPACDYPQVTIAKKSTALPALDKIAERGSMSTEMLLFLMRSVEADLTTVISGGTGAGKALHKDTLIPTPKGFKSVAELAVGDTIFDETGARTTIERKYCPNDPVSYQVKFKNGETIKSSAGHLWQVTLLNEKVTTGPSMKPFFNAEQVSNLKSSLGKRKLVSLIEFANLVGLPPHDVRQLSGWISADKAQGSVKVRAKNVLVSDYDTMLETLLEENKKREKLQSLIASLSAGPQPRPSRVMTTQELVEYGVRNKAGRLNFAIEALSASVDYDKMDLPIDPYTLGAWLGDGNSDRGKIWGIDQSIADRVASVYPIKSHTVAQKATQTQPLHSWTFEGLRGLLSANNLIKNKHIPDIYKTSSKEQRLELLAGLIDTDGTVDNRGAIVLQMSNESIVTAAREIVVSLGWDATKVKSKRSSYKDTEGNIVECKTSYWFSFHADSALNLSVERKKQRLQERRFDRDISQEVRSKRHYITEIAQIQDNPEDYFCFQVDSPSHLFLCSEDFIPTHNTTMLEAMTKLMPHSLRIGVAEDAPELYLEQPNVSYLHSVPWQPGMNPNDVATLSWVVAQYQRMRTDKLIIGETRGAEFADFLIAANSGMDGSLTTLHANDPVSALDKMTNFALKADNSPIRSINTAIASSIDLVIQLIILPDGRHRMSQIQEITNTVGRDEGASITTNTLYKYDVKTDTFAKITPMTDQLRKKFASKGVDIQPFLDSPVDVQFPGHSGAHELERLINASKPDPTLTNLLPHQNGLPRSL